MALGTRLDYFLCRHIKKNMADDDRDRRKRSNAGVPEWKETCIGVWSRSTKGHQANDNDNNRFCTGISVVKINKDMDPSKVMLDKIKTRGIQIVIRERGPAPMSPTKAHDHTNIRVERTEPDDKDIQENEDGETNTGDDQVPLTRRVIDVMMMKKTNLEKNVEHYKNEGIKVEDVWNGVCNTCSKYYKTTVRLVSYCHPIEKIGQIYGFAADRVKNASRRWLEGSDDENKKK